MSRLPSLERPGRDNGEHVPSTAVVAVDDSTGLPQARAFSGALSLPLMDDDYWAKYPDPLPLVDIAAIVRLHETTVLRRLQSGEIPGHFIGGSWIVFKDEFRAWLGSMRNVPIPPPADVDPLSRFDDELGVPELIELFGKGKHTILRWLHNNSIPGYLIANRWTVYKAELRETLDETSNQTPSR